jgi:glycosyltransferase involved in cell wall biosynthesis
MRILVICDRYPYPLANGQNLRIYNYVRLLRTRHEFDLICYGEQSTPAEIESLFHHVEACPAPSKHAALRPSSVRQALSPDSMVPRSETVRRAIGRRLRKAEYDLVWLSGWDMVVNLPEPLGVPLLADIVDDGVLERWRVFKARPDLRSKAVQAKRVLVNYLFERRYFCGAAACIVVSERDAKVLRWVCPRTDVRVVQNGVDVDYYQPVDAREEPATLVFEGAMDFGPNRDAARVLTTEILPQVRRKVPGAKAIIVGRNPSPAIRSLASDHVTVTGTVPDIRPYVRRGTVFVCPMRMGAGIKNKLLQAWAMRKAVVATPMAAGGLNAREGENILLGVDVTSLSAAIIDLLGNPERRRALAMGGYKTVHAEYTWEKKSAALEAVMRKVAGVGG